VVEPTSTTVRSAVIHSFESHPALNAFPLMTGGAFAALKDDISRNSLRHAVVLKDRSGRKPLLLDGRNRLRACFELGIEPELTGIGDDVDPFAYVISANLQRRMLNESQRAIVAAKLALLPRGRPSKSRRTRDLSSAEAAHVLNVGESTVERARRVLSKGVPELVAAVEQGEVSVNEAAELAKRGRREQRNVLAGDPTPRETTRAENRARTSMTSAVRLTESDLIALQALAELGDESRDPRARAGVVVLRRIVPALPGRAS
jgi:hypothetical protein